MQRSVFWNGVVWAAALLMMPGVALAGIDMQEGEWETTVVTTIEGAGMAMPPMSSTASTCLTKDDLVPNPNPDQSKNCKVTNQKISGNTVSWSILCDQDGQKMEGDGEMTYHGASYSGTMKTKSASEGRVMTAVMKLSGRHLGPCTGKKSSVAGSGEAEKYKAMADKAMAQSNQEMAKYKAASRAGGEIIGLSVPAAEPAACRQQGFSAMADCMGKSGDLNLQPGMYQITLERASQMGTMDASPVETRQEERCLTLDDPVPETISGGRAIRDVRRSKEKINWTHQEAQTAVEGGLVYQGSTVSGVVTESSQPSPEMKMKQVTKVTAKRIGDGNCVTGRGYTAQGRAYTSAAPAAKPVQAQGQVADPLQKGREVMDDPVVKGVRNILGF